MKIQQTLISVLALAGASAAQSLDVAIVAAAISTDTGCHFTDPQAKLMASGLFNTVDIVNVYSATPTLAELQAYDSVICWTNVTPANYVDWGDVMADYVDAGGGVVVAVFANSSTSSGRHLGGRWATGGYEVIVSQSGNQSGPASLGTVHDVAHPVMSGVASFNGGTSGFRPLGTALTAGSTLIAEWDDGRVLVAEGAIPGRIDLGFYPPSAACSSTFWVESTDGALLMANALAHAGSGGVGQGTPYCFGDPGVGTLCPCGNDNDGSVPGSGCHNGFFPSGAQLNSWGRASVGNDSLVLKTTGLEPNNTGLYFQGNNRVNGGDGNVFGDGLRCAGGGLVRLQIRSADATGFSETTVGLAAAGGVAAGETKRYQCWYRTTVNPPCGLGLNDFNLSNGFEIVWGP